MRRKGRFGVNNVDGCNQDQDNDLSIIFVDIVRVNIGTCKSTIMDPNADRIEAKTTKATEGLSEETIAHLSERRRELEAHILDTFNGKEMWFQERRLQFKGVPKITTNEWGVSIKFESENFRTLSLSGRWDIIVSYKNGLGAQYAGWTVCFDCPYPEMGTSYN